MPVSLLFGRKFNQTSIGQLLLDASISITPEYVNNITQFEVENGAVITDHIDQRPETITVQGFITNSPIAFLGGLNIQPGARLGAVPLFRNEDGFETRISGNNVFREDNLDRVETAFSYLLFLMGRNLRLRDGKADIDSVTFAPVIIDVISGLQTFTNMVITRLSVPRDTNTGDTLRFTIQLQKIRFATVGTETLINTSNLNGKAPGTTDQAPSTKDFSNVQTKTPKKTGSLLVNTLVKAKILSPQ